MCPCVGRFNSVSRVQYSLDVHFACVGQERTSEVGTVLEKNPSDRRPVFCPGGIMSTVHLKYISYNGRYQVTVAISRLL
jgi:hypothetical protein